MEAIKKDSVNDPDHYKVNGSDAISVIEAKLGGTKSPEYRGYLQGNIIKYLLRAKYKGKYEEDIKKAQWYTDRLVKTFE